MEPKNKIIGKLSISWTHESNGWGTPQLRREVRQMCDQLYTKFSSQQIMDDLTRIDQSVEGDEHPEAAGLIITAYQRHNNK